MAHTGWTGGRAATVAAVAILALSGAIRPAAAQEAAADTAELAPDFDPPGTLELTGYVGALLPISVLASQGDTLQAEPSTALSLGAELDFWFAGTFGVAIQAGYAAPDIVLTFADPDSGMQDAQPIGSAKTLHAEALLRWRPRLSGSAALVLPYFGVGVGMRRLDFEENEVGFDDESDMTFVLNLGSQIRLSDALFLRLDVRDLISTFEGGPFEQSDTQHDVYAQIGLGFGL